MLDYLLALGARKRASDVSLEPRPEHVAVRYRIDGFAFRVDPLPKTFEASLERALFAMFGLDPARRERPQTGRTTARLGEDDFDLVIQTVPETQGVSATIRLVNRATFVKDFATLGLELEDRVRLVEEIRSGLGLDPGHFPGLQRGAHHRVLDHELPHPGPARRALDRGARAVDDGRGAAGRGGERARGGRGSRRRCGRWWRCDPTC